MYRWIQQTRSDDRTWFQENQLCIFSSNYNIASFIADDRENAPAWQQLQIAS